MVNYSNSTFVDPDPESALWLGIIYAAYATIGIPSNCLVLIITIINKKVRSIPINACIFSLALADTMSLVSCLSSTIWAITFNITVCKVMGVGVYVFIVMSMMLPSCLALCRHAGIRSELELHPIHRKLKTRKGIVVLNGIFWIYGILFMLPFIIADKFGLDAIGCCGVGEIDSIALWVYYFIFVIGMLFASYIVTFTLYRKLTWWAQTTSSQMTLTPQTNESLMATRSIIRMIKWLLFVPLAFYYPAVTCVAALRINPQIVSLRTARLFMITVPLPHIIDPIVTMLCVKCYKKALVELLVGKDLLPNAIHPNYRAPSDPEAAL